MTNLFTFAKIFFSLLFFTSTIQFGDKSLPSLVKSFQRIISHQIPAILIHYRVCQLCLSVGQRADNRVGHNWTLFQETKSCFMLLLSESASIKVVKMHVNNKDVVSLLFRWMERVRENLCFIFYGSRLEEKSIITCDVLS